MPFFTFRHSGIFTAEARRKTRRRTQRGKRILGLAGQSTNDGILEYIKIVDIQKV
jgi:hypothetical protein